LAYETALIPYLANLYNNFHVPFFRKHVSDSQHMLKRNEVQVREDNLSYKAKLVSGQDHKRK